MKVMPHYSQSIISTSCGITCGRRRTNNIILLVICRWDRALVFHLILLQLLKMSHLCQFCLKFGTKVEAVQREPFPFAKLGGKNYWGLLPSSTLEGKARGLLLLQTQRITKEVTLYTKIMALNSKSFLHVTTRYNIRAYWYLFFFSIDII